MKDQPKWLPLPDPRKCELLHAPFGPGVYQLRNRVTSDLVLTGRSKNCAERMTSLLPEPLGKGKRSNNEKGAYTALHLADIDYRCWPFATTKEAAAKEQQIKLMGEYLFPETRGGRRE